MMSETAVVVPGLSLVVVLGVLAGRRLRAECRAGPGPSLATVAMVWALYAVHCGLVAFAAWRSTWRFDLPDPLALGGWLLIATGSAFYASAAIAFASLRRMSGLDASRLVTGGIYRWSRNPQTVGWTLVLLGLGLWRRSAMVLLLGAAFWVSFRLYLPLEEELLGRLFGGAYRRYRGATHRYFGPPRRGTEPARRTPPWGAGGDDVRPDR
jgi:protein-S-isoprenylcysteine O-methyltransferase Ste14